MKIALNPWKSFNQNDYWQWQWIQTNIQIGDLLDVYRYGVSLHNYAKGVQNKTSIHQLTCKIGIDGGLLRRNREADRV